MAQLSESSVKELLQKALSYSKADECEVSLIGGRTGNLRFARNAVSTSGAADQAQIGVQSTFGKKTGTTTINEFDPASLEKAVRRSEDLARLAPENPEYMPFLGPQEYLTPGSYFASTAGITPDFRAAAAAASINPTKAKGLTSAGFQQDFALVEAIMNSRGLFAYQRSSGIDFSVTIRTADGKGSGYGVSDFNDASKMDTGAVSQIAIEKALRSAETRAIEPGKYTVILEPAASVDLISHMITSMDARQADEGRNFLSKAGGGTRLGEKLMDEQVTISSDPQNPEIPGDVFSPDGRPRRKVDWIKDGVVTNLAYERFWAQKKGVANPTPRVGNGVRRGLSVGGFEGAQGWVMAGGDASLADLIKGVKRGILVTRMWYIRPVDPQTLLFTGLTRDGTFFVENGEIKFAIKNFRFNESPVIMLNNVETLGRPVRMNGCVVPPMVLRDFTFSSLSDAV